MNEVLESLDTDGDAEALLRVAKARTALQQAAEVVEHIRASLTPSDGRGEAGVELRMQVTPLRTASADDADELYVRLFEWVISWSRDLDVAPPATVGWARVDEDSRARSPELQMMGFNAGTTPAGAASLTRILVIWLLTHLDRIVDQPSGSEFLSDVTSMVWAFRAKYKLTPERVKGEPLPRACPECNRFEMRAEFFGESLLAAEMRGESLADAVEGVSVRCGYCRYEIKPTAAKVARWLS